LLDHDIETYFEHKQCDFAIEPRIIILNYDFEYLIQMTPTAESSQDEKRKYAQMFAKVQAETVAAE